VRGVDDEDPVEEFAAYAADPVGLENAIGLVTCAFS
jgi:hypothetical protein